MKKNVLNHVDKDIFGLFKNQEGFSLLIVLLAITVVASVFSSLLWYQQDRAIRQKAFAAGWHLVQVSKAARVYVRDKSTTPADPDFIHFEVGALAGSSREVPIADLIAAGHLPTDFTDTNPLGQTIRIFAATYPPAGGVGAVSTAYVITDEATAGSRAERNANAKTMASLMQGAREAGMAASSPLIVNGTNYSDDCNGEPSVMVWDTGCLNATDVNTVTGGAVAIAEGQIMVPAWRVVDHDLRALMRYPQPENVGANTMMTDMHFGDDPINPTPNTYSAPGVLAPGGSNRFNIDGVNSLTVLSLMAQDQGAIGDEGETQNLDLLSSGGVVNVSDMVVNVGGSLTVENGGNLSVSNNGGDLPNVLHMPENAGANTITVGHNMNAENVSVSAVGVGSGIATMRENIDTNTFDAGSIADMALVSSETITGTAGAGVASLNVNNGNLVTEELVNVGQLQINGDDLRIFTQMNMAGPRQITVDNSNPYPVDGGKSFRAGILNNSGSLSVGGEATFEQGGRFDGNVTINSLSVNICDGDCPDELNNNPGPVEP